MSDPLSSATAGRLPGKRLILCLDGTWNNRTTSTSIFHLYNLVAEHDAQGVRQLRYYDEGVGTGMLDKVTGGAFGVGLDENVIQAYEWLIEHYDDGDEIYLFGFSRGAFTARSVGGLIMKCGLLLPGAPITVEQLWNGYRVLGHVNRRDHLPQKTLWEKTDGKDERPYRELIELKWDTGEVRVTDPNLTERLLITYSRRVPIHCIGVFDTVGAMGVDSLGLSWLHTRAAAFHNTNPSTLIKHGFHALAIDEHRYSFRPVLWQQYVPKNPDPAAPANLPKDWSNYEQRWFAGAHANIGGGYADNPLCLFPLEWMLQKTAAIGLAFRLRPTSPTIADCLPLLKSPDGYPPILRDSYAEFLGGAWKLLTLGKGYYRPIGAPPTNRKDHTLYSLNETIDESALAFWAAEPTYRPKNLGDYLQRAATAAREPDAAAPP